jgi:hypothetical protein
MFFLGCQVIHSKYVWSDNITRSLNVGDVDL